MASPRTTALMLRLAGGVDFMFAIVCLATRYVKDRAGDMAAYGLAAAALVGAVSLFYSARRAERQPPGPGT